MLPVQAARCQRLRAAICRAVPQGLLQRATGIPACGQIWFRISEQSEGACLLLLLGCTEGLQICEDGVKGEDCAGPGVLQAWHLQQVVAAACTLARYK